MTPTIDLADPSHDTYHTGPSLNQLHRSPFLKWQLQSQPYNQLSVISNMTNGDIGLRYWLSPCGLDLDKLTNRVFGEQSRKGCHGFSNQGDKRMENRSRVS